MNKTTFSALITSSSSMGFTQIYITGKLMISILMLNLCLEGPFPLAVDTEVPPLLLAFQWYMTLPVTYLPTYILLLLFRKIFFLQELCKKSLSIPEVCQCDNWKSRNNHISIQGVSMTTLIIHMINY